jgi:hypothetical protein
MPQRARHAVAMEDDLFSVGAEPLVRHRLASAQWPPPEHYPVNHAQGRVRDQVWDDLSASSNALVVAGFASIAKVIELVAAHAQRPDPSRVRILLGTEPFGTERVDFGSAGSAFTDDVRRYWLDERGISLRLSAKIVQTMMALDEGWLQVRFVPGTTRLHAKIYVADRAATVGSSNFTDAGLSSQFEANVRFNRTGEPQGYAQTRLVAENYWQVGRDWGQELRVLLNDLLQFVPWEEALARACADLLEGQWAARYLGGAGSQARLWPSQIAGIAQAMWVVENVGSVLVADATGSGKTRMGAHLTRAVRDRLWSTGRVRGDLTVLVCPPAVENQWLRESAACGLTVRTVSQGLLSRSTTGTAVHEEAVGSAQILAVDEAHNFLSRSSNRTRHVREASADHVLLFTATPINRGAEDLLSLVDLLGADNFEDETLDLLDQLGRQRQDTVLTAGQQDLLRREIQRFTVRRTKAALNGLVAQDPDAYRHTDSGRVCRYPTHEPHTYATGETAADERVADTIRRLALQLIGLPLIGAVIAVPPSLRREYTDQRWLDLRLGAAAGLAQHHVLAAMRSSAAALREHLVGTVAAVDALGLILNKPQPTGDMLATVARLREQGPPRVELACELPGWLRSESAWQMTCEQEIERYEAIHTAAQSLSQARERAKAQLLTTLARRHSRVLAFDRHPISLASISRFVDADARDVILASGAAPAARKQVRERFAIDSERRGIALCTDAMSEGLNLQGASAIVHLDLPTTLRVAEQRVGRVDRMDSPYDVIEAWWPDDSVAFATRANELLATRNSESRALLGSNLSIPELAGTGATSKSRTETLIDVDAVARVVETLETGAWDGIEDALAPVRGLVAGSDALLTPEQYALHRGAGARIIARVSPVQSQHAWAFFACRGHANGAPRWVLIHGSDARVVHGLDQVTRELRLRLAERPESRGFDEACEEWLTLFLRAAAKSEAALIPRRLQRALQQMHATCRAWAQAARSAGDEELAYRWEAVARLAVTGDDEILVDLYQVGERWLQVVQPLREAARRKGRRNRYSRLSDIDAALRSSPIALDTVEGNLRGLQRLEPFDQRVSSCILGVPN